MKRGGIAFALFLLAGCAGQGQAPIRDNAPPLKTPARPAPVAKPAEPGQDGRHLVEKGDTLFAIAFQNGLDYRDLAFWNGLSSPDVIMVGQVLRLTPPDDAGRARGVETIPLRDNSFSAFKPLADESAPLAEPVAQRLPYSEANWAAVSGEKPAPAAAVPKAVEMPQARTAAPPAAPVADSDDPDNWRWPADGALLGTYGQGGGKGIDIAGERLSPVLAAAPGKVVYSGSGLRGYGKMLIVKHADEFLTAYAHNQTLLAKEGDWVGRGQKIAEMGDTDSDRVKLHFEVRQYGKPLDPLKYLPERK